MAVTNAKTLIIGGGPAGVHMGYRLQERDEPACIWEMTDQLGGKAGNQYEMDGITMNTGVNFIPSAYREVFKLLDELGMKNLDEVKIQEPPNVVDQVVKCFLMNNLDETKCQDLTVYPPALQAVFAQPMQLLGVYTLVRGIILMKEEGYFDTFVEITTAEGFDWAAEPLNFSQLVGLHFQRLFGTEIPAYKAAMDQYTDGAFSDSTNLEIDFNKYAVYEKSDDAKEALNQKATDFMQDEEIYFFRAIVEQFVTGLGYGNLDDTPLYYVGMMMSPTYTDFWANILAKDPPNFVGGLYMLEGGFPRVLDKMVTKQNLDVQFNREVTKVVHVQEDDDSSYFEVYYKDNDLQSVFNRKLEKTSKSEKSDKKSTKSSKSGKSSKSSKSSKSTKKVKKSSKNETKPPPKMERFDQVISGMSSQNFVKIYNKGKEIQDPFLCREACAWSSTIAEVAPSEQLVGAFDGKTAVFGKGSLYLEDPSIVATALLDPLRVKDVPLENDGGSRRMQMYHQYAYEPVLSSDTQALTKQELDTLFDERYGAGGLEITEVYSTVIVPNYSATSKDLDTCDPWDVHELQGKNGLYFIGGTVNFDNLELLVRYNNYILDTHFEATDIEEITYPPVCTGEDVIVPDGLAEFPDSIMQGSYQLTSPFENAFEVMDTTAVLPTVAAFGGVDVLFQLRGICSLPSNDDTYNYFEAVTDSSLLPPGVRGLCRLLRTSKIDSAEPITWFEYQNVGVDGVESSVVEQADGQLELKFSNCPDFPLGDAYVEATKIEEMGV